MSRIDSELGDILRYIRKDKMGFTQPKFGEAIGKQQEDISAIEKGKKTLKIHDWLALAEEYNNPIFALIALGLDKIDEIKYNTHYDLQKLKLS